MARVVLDRAALQRVLHSPSGEVARDLTRRAERVVNKAKLLCPVNQGRLRSSITFVIESEGDRLIARIGTNVRYACILGAHTSVVTNRGAMTIGQIRPGDQVMTQSGDFHAVMEATHFPVTEKPDLVEIVVPWRAGLDHTLTVTADHKLLVQRGDRLKWVEAGDLNGTDEVQVRRKVAPNAGSGRLRVCERCHGEHRGQGVRFCSAVCRDAYWRTRGHPLTGRDRGEAFSAAQSASRRRFLAEHPESHPNRNQRHVSGLEMTLAAWLAMRDLAAEPHPYRAGLWPDFYVASEHRVYEADGAYWHRDQAADIARDRVLLNATPGLEIVHMHFYDERHSPKPLDPHPLPGVWYVAVNPSPESYVEPTVFTGVRPISIRPYRFVYRGKPRGRVPQLYDLAVEGEHSFLANGVLVSNSWVHDGTGIYGPHRTPIIPVRSPVLVFTPKGGSVVFARSVRGMKGRPFLANALDAGL